MAESAVPPVDYTSRDYPAIRQNLIDAIPPRMPEWTSRNPNDFGMVLLEVFAQMGDMLSFTADRVANEAFLPTATQRGSVLQIAKLLDYRPGGNVAAKVGLLFTNSTATPALVPAGSTVTTTAVVDDRTITILFETDEEITVPANDDAAVTATEGSTVPGEILATSTGGLDQRYPLFNSPVIEGSVRVFVNEGVNAEWSYLEHIINAGPLDTVYTLDVDANDVVYVVFGDGVSGKIPNPASTISADYRVGGGAIGNVAANTLQRIGSALPPGLTVNNSAPAAGGGDAETLAQIRQNAPRSLFTLDRAVTLGDYSNLAIRVSGVAKAQSVSGSSNSVTVYIAPVGGGGLENDGITPTAQFAETKTEVLSYLNARKPAPTTVVVGNPSYVSTDVSLVVYARPTFAAGAVRQAVTEALVAMFDFDSVILGDRVTISDLYKMLTFVPAVDYAVVTLLERSGDTPGTPTEILYAPYEIPMLGEVMVDVIGGVS